MIAIRFKCQQILAAGVILLVRCLNRRPARHYISIIGVIVGRKRSSVRFQSDYVGSTDADIYDIRPVANIL